MSSAYIPTATATNLAEVVKAYRDNNTALRRLDRSRINHCSTATANAVTRRRAANRAAERDLLEVTGKTLVGLLTEEKGLIERISWAREAGQSRPDLTPRLAKARREISALLAA